MPLYILIPALTLAFWLCRRAALWVEREESNDCD